MSRKGRSLLDRLMEEAEEKWTFKWLEERGPYGVGGGLPSWLPLWVLVRVSEVLGALS